MRYFCSVSDILSGLFRLDIFLDTTANMPIRFAVSIRLSFGIATEMKSARSLSNLNFARWELEFQQLDALYPP